MSRDWRPGDVAIVTYSVGPRAGRSEVVMRADCRSSREWVSPSVDRGSRLRPDEWVSDARPLIAIDPEDREQVERFVRTYFDEWEKTSDSKRIASPDESMPRPSHITAAQAALRSLLTPPRPEEPTGLGAVVEDANGDRWALGANGKWANLSRRGTYAAWAGFTATRVLFAGGAA